MTTYSWLGKPIQLTSFTFHLLRRNGLNVTYNTQTNIDLGIHKLTITVEWWEISNFEKNMKYRYRYKRQWQSASYNNTVTKQSLQLEITFLSNQPYVITNASTKQLSTSLYYYGTWTVKLWLIKFTCQLIVNVIYTNNFSWD